MLVLLPILISVRIKRYFTKPLMFIVKWDSGEFRMKFNEMKISAAELKNFLAGKVSNLEIEQ